MMTEQRAVNHTLSRISEDSPQPTQQYTSSTQEPRNELRKASSADPPPKLRLIHRSKFSSTATMFLSNSIKSADVGEIILCLSRSMAALIKREAALEKKKVFKEIFSEQSFPLGDDKIDLVNPPTEEVIEDFLVEIFQGQEMSAECGVMSAVYIDRLIQLTGITLHASNWRRILLGALLLSSKVWEDLAVWNVDFLNLFPNLTLKDLNRLEREYLMALNYSVALKAGEYAKYYFKLRELSDITEEFFPLKPLDAKGASLLEARSVGLEENEKIFHIHQTKSYSLNPYESSTSVSIEQIQSKYASISGLVEWYILKTFWPHSFCSILPK